MPRVALAVFPAIVALGALALLTGTAAAEPEPATGSCRAVAGAPFLYSVVIPVSSVQCDSATRRLRIVTVLTSDGVEAASATRDCRNTDVCWLTVDAAAPDRPGDQVWCTHTVAYANSHFIGAASACETDEF
jgi:hypothetical protein